MNSHCSDLILSPPFYNYSFLCPSSLYRQHILTISLPILNFHLENSSMPVPIHSNVLLLFFQHMQQSPHGRWIFIIELLNGLLCILEVPTRLPGILLITVILPSDEVLNSPSPFSCC